MAGDTLSKKLALYGLKFTSLKRSLSYFNIIVFLMIVWISSDLFISFWVNKSYSDLSWVGIIVGAAFLLRRVISANMIHPITVRSVEWLTREARINPRYFRKLIEARMHTKHCLSSVDSGVYDVEFQIFMRRAFLGQRFIFILENTEYKKSDFISVGILGGRRTPSQSLYYENGEIQHSFKLGETRIRPGNWEARLYIFDAAFKGINKWNPILHKQSIVIDTKKIDGQSVEPIDLDKIARNIAYFGSSSTVKDVVCSDPKSDQTAAMLLEIKQFKKIFKRTSHLVFFQSMNGFLEKSEIASSLKWYKYYFHRFVRFILRRKDIRPLKDKY